VKRILVLLLAASIALFAAGDTVKKIKRSQKNLSAVQAEKKRTSRRLEKIAADIKKTEKELAYIDKKLEVLERDRNATALRYEKLKKELSSAQKDLDATAAELEKKRKAFLQLLSERFSILFAMRQRHEATRESVIDEEVFKAYKAHNEKMLASMRKELEALKRQKRTKKARRDRLKKELKRLAQRQKNYEEQKRKKRELLKRLAADEEKYNAKLQKIIDRQNALRATLAKLNILRKQEVEEARRRAAARKEAMRKERERKRKLRLAKAKAKKAREALKRAKTEAEKKAAQEAVKAAETEEERVGKVSEAVHSFNASYKPEKTYRYRGRKTISPLPGAKVVKKFGTYVDPVYKIKIFNEGVTLQAPKPDAMVHNVLNGKVVFAGDTSMLGKVVVVAHSGQIHTVYAGLSKIAPLVRKGKKIKRGYVVGRVRRKLIFEVTKNTRHIDPLTFIRLR
jgi:septal ring factor EnvC (AmiA/AmiB activator)